MHFLNSMAISGWIFTISPWTSRVASWSWSPTPTPTRRWLWTGSPSPRSPSPVASPPSNSPTSSSSTSPSPKRWRPTVREIGINSSSSSSSKGDGDIMLFRYTALRRDGCFFKIREKERSERVEYQKKSSPRLFHHFSWIRLSHKNICTVCKERATNIIHFAWVCTDINIEQIGRDSRSWKRFCWLYNNNKKKTNKEVVTWMLENNRNNHERNIIGENTNSDHR